MAVLLGGRAAEQLVMGDISTGAADDLAKASDIAQEMVTRYGMVPQLGQVAYERNHTPFLEGAGQWGQERHYSDDTARHIDDAVRNLVDQAYAKALATLSAQRDLLEQGAQMLLAQETLTEAELLPLAERARIPSSAV